MKTKTKSLFLITVIFLITITAQVAFTKTIVVAASGGDRDNRANQWRKEKVDDFCDGIRITGPDTADVNKPTTKADFLSTLQSVAADCNCGDDIVIYYNGHGTRGRLQFVRERKSVSTQDILDAIENMKCCCKVRIVIHACYSGSHIEELAKDPHIISIYTSCSGDEKGYKDIYPIRDSNGVFVQTPLNEDWPTGYNEDLNLLPDGTDLDEALETASKSARTKTQEIFREKTTPQKWIREEIEVLAHVEEKTSSTIYKVTIWEPNSLNGETRRIKVIDNDSNVPDGLGHCDWITATIVPTVDNKAYLQGDIDEANDPEIDIFGHVERLRTNDILIHIWEPNFLRCNQKYIDKKSDANLPPGLKVCNWIKVSATIPNPLADYNQTIDSNFVIVAAPNIPVYGHVKKVNKSRKEVTVHVWEPQVWHCQYKKIKYNTLPADLKRCTWIISHFPYNIVYLSSATPLSLFSNRMSN